MNFVIDNLTGMRTSTKHILCYLSLAVLFSIYLPGCSDEYHPPSADELIDFKNAGHNPPRVDLDRLVDAGIGGGPHRVVAGEVIEFTMPTILQIVTAEEPEITGKTAPHIARVSESGTITLPVVGEMSVEGKTLAEIESAVINAYYPEYTVARPSVFARIIEYKTAAVSITGAVNKPGIYSLRSDQMSLVSLLMEAEGIVDEGAALIRITRSNPTESSSDADGLNRIDVQLRFRPTHNSSTKGGLTITSDRGIILSKELDIRSEIERDILLERLIEIEPRASVATVNKRLCSLAAILGSTSNETYSHDNSEYGDVHDWLIGRRPLEKYAGEKQRLTTSAATARPGYGLNKNDRQSISENLGFYDKFDTDDKKLSIAADLRPQKPVLAKNQIIAEQVASTSSREPASLVLPIKGLNIPFADVALRDGDRVIVERIREPKITVVGLVNKAGNFPYPPDVEYNLMHALGFAGGLNISAEPRYATVYRLAADGTTVSATFNIAGIAKSEDPTQALSLPLKPYDVVAVEHTPRTRAKVFWDRVFRFYVSTHLTSDEIFGDD